MKGTLAYHQKPPKKLVKSQKAKYSIFALKPLLAFENLIRQGHTILIARSEASNPSGV